MEIDPQNTKAQLLAATLAFDQQQFTRAIEVWEKTLAGHAIEPDLVKELSANIQEARSLQGGSRSLSTDLPDFSKQFDPSLRGTVSVDQLLKIRIDPTDTLFIFARSTEGASMPVAVVKATAADLPYSFYLDDAHSVMPGKKLSEAKEVVIVARLSKTGDAAASTGDLEGTSVSVKPGSREVKVVINTTLP